MDIPAPIHVREIQIFNNQVVADELSVNITFSDVKVKKNLKSANPTKICKLSVKANHPVFLKFTKQYHIPLDVIIQPGELKEIHCRVQKIRIFYQNGIALFYSNVTVVSNGIEVIFEFPTS